MPCFQVVLQTVTAEHRRLAGIPTQRDELWADQLRSAACCLLGACDGLEAQSILNQLVQEPDAVLAKSDLNSCFCSLCKTSLAMMAYKVSRWQTGSKSQQSAGQHHQCVLVEQMLHLTPVTMSSGLCHRFQEQL